jgi:hypothetical protein
MKHVATSRFWDAYDRLPASVRRVADENYQLLKSDSFHPSLHFKRIGRLWSVRVGIKYRALGVQEGEAVVWFWIGTHSDYDKLVP